MRQLQDQPEAARAWLPEQAEDPTASPLALSIIGEYLAYSGDPQAALKITGCSAVDLQMLFFPLMREMYKLPGFKDLVRKQGMVAWSAGRCWQSD